jgi:hypothetical protein
MTVFAKTTAAPEPKTRRAFHIALLYAVLLTGMALAQLYTFDEFIEIIPSLSLPVGEALGYLIAPLIVVLEVFALPFLLRMRLSPAFRFVSMLFGWGVPLVWLAISLWLVVTAQPVVTIGFLGGIGELAPGWWAVLVSVALGILAAWASWGMWPVARRSPSSKPVKK